MYSVVNCAFNWIFFGYAKGAYFVDLYSFSRLTGFRPAFGSFCFSDIGKLNSYITGTKITFFLFFLISKLLCEWCILWSVLQLFSWWTKFNSVQLWRKYVTLNECEQNLLSGWSKILNLSCSEFFMCKWCIFCHSSAALKILLDAGQSLVEIDLFCRKMVHCFFAFASKLPVVTDWSTFSWIYIKLLWSSK